MKRKLVQVMALNEKAVEEVLYEHRDWRVIGFNITQGGVGGYATTAWILFECDG